jgi:transposase
MESTSTYWVPIWDILWEDDFDLTLVNPLHIKQMPGRKSDAKDAQWIAELLYKNMLRGSFVPSPLIQLTPKVFFCIAETGGDMSAFETSGKFTGWAGLRPRNDENC